MITRTLTYLVLPALVTLGYVGDAGAGKLTAAVCEADHKELLTTIERNRIAGIKQINEHLAAVTDEKKRAHLIEMREKSWDQEEEHRTMAVGIRRDCLAAVK